MIKTLIIFFILNSLYFAQSDCLFIQLTSGEIKSYDVSEICEIKISGTPTDIKEAQFIQSAAQVFSLYPNYPNPFNPSTTIEYDIPMTGNVEISIFDIRGRQIYSTGSNVQQAGMHKIIWDGRNNSGISVSSGTYFCRVHYNDSFLIHKMLLIK